MSSYYCTQINNSTYMIGESMGSSQCFSTYSGKDSMHCCIKNGIKKGHKIFLALGNDSGSQSYLSLPDFNHYRALYDFTPPEMRGFNEIILAPRGMYYYEDCDNQGSDVEGAAEKIYTTSLSNHATYMVDVLKRDYWDLDNVKVFYSNNPQKKLSLHWIDYNLHFKNLEELITFANEKRQWYYREKITPVFDENVYTQYRLFRLPGSKKLDKDYDNTLQISNDDNNDWKRLFVGDINKVPDLDLYNAWAANKHVKYCSVEKVENKIDKKVTKIDKKVTKIDKKVNKIDKKVIENINVETFKKILEKYLELSPAAADGYNDWLAVLFTIVNNSYSLNQDIKQDFIQLACWFSSQTNRECCYSELEIVDKMNELYSRVDHQNKQKNYPSLLLEIKNKINNNDEYISWYKSIFNYQNIVDIVFNSSDIDFLELISSKIDVQKLFKYNEVVYCYNDETALYSCEKVIIKKYIISICRDVIDNALKCACVDEKKMDDLLDKKKSRFNFYFQKQLQAHVIENVQEKPGFKGFNLCRNLWPLADKKVFNLVTKEICDRGPQHNFLFCAENRYLGPDNSKLDNRIYKLLKTWFQDEEELKYILGRVIYTFSGNINNKDIVVLLGSNNSGKTSFMNMLKNLMGNFCVHMKNSVMLVPATKKRFVEDPGSATTHLNKLEKNPRLAILEEVDSATRLVESNLKKLTGDDSLVNRKLRVEETTIDQITTKFWVPVNQVPYYDDKKMEIAKRVRVIPCYTTFYNGEHDKKERVQAIEKKIQNTHNDTMKNFYKKNMQYMLPADHNLRNIYTDLRDHFFTYIVNQPYDNNNNEKVPESITNVVKNMKEPEYVDEFIAEFLEENPDGKKPFPFDLVECVYIWFCKKHYYSCINRRILKEKFCDRGFEIKMTSKRVGGRPKKYMAIYGWGLSNTVSVSEETKRELDTLCKKTDFNILDQEDINDQEDIELIVEDEE